MKVLNATRLRVLARSCSTTDAFVVEAAKSLTAQLDWLRAQPFVADDGAAADDPRWHQWNADARAPSFAAARDVLGATAHSVLAAVADGRDTAAHDDADRQQFLSQAYFTLAGLECAVAGSSAAGDDDADDDTAPPPHRSLVRALDRDALASLLAFAVEDIAAFSREKHGVSAEVDVRVVTHAHTADDGGGGGSRQHGASVSLVEGPFAFIVAELLKNAHMAMVKRFGILEVEDAPPIEIDAVIGRRGGLRLTVADQGAGVVAAAGSSSSSIFDWGVTHSESQKEDRWRHSREMGAAMAGQGVGLPRSRVFAAFHNGGTLRNTANAATQGPEAEGDAVTRFELFLPP